MRLLFSYPLVNVSLQNVERERAQSQQQSQQLEQLTREMQALRQQVADAEARRAAAEQQQAARREQVQSAIDGLYSAQQRLASGSAGIEAELAQAQAVLSGQAQRDLQAARIALQNRDLSAARADPLALRAVGGNTCCEGQEFVPAHADESPHLREGHGDSVLGKGLYPGVGVRVVAVH